MSHSVWPHIWQPTRLCHPWDYLGKNTGVCCHFLLQWMKVKSESEVTQSCPTVRSHGLQPTRLLRPWDFPGKRNGIMYTYYDNHKSKDLCVWRGTDNSIWNKRSQQESQERLDIRSDVGLLLFSCSVTFNSLQSHGLQLPRLPCPSPSPRVGSNSCLLSQWCYPLLSPSPPAFNLSHHQGLLFQWVNSSQQVTKVFNFSISPSCEYSWFISFSIDWFDLLAVQGTLKSLLQHRVQRHQCLHAQPFLSSSSYILYMTTGKTIALTRWTFISSVMSLLFIHCLGGGIKWVAL